MEHLDQQFTYPFVSEFLRHAPSAIAMFDGDLRYIMVTEKWLQDYGLVDHDIIGKSHYEVFPEIPNEWKELHRRTLDGETLSSDADPFLRTDGRLDWVKWKNVPWYSKDGTIGGMIMFTEVITDQVLMVRAMENAVGSIIRIDANRRIDFVNEAFAQSIDLSQRDVVDRTLNDFLNPCDVEKLHDAFERVKNEGKTTLDLKVQPSKSDEFDLQATIVGNTNRDGEAAGYYIFGDDITQEKKAEEQSARQTEWLRMTQRIGNVGHWLYDLTDQSIHWSDQVFEIHGLDPEKDSVPAIDAAVEFYHPDDRDTVSEHLENAINRKEPFEFELRLIRPDGEQRWVTSTGECRLDENGDVRALFGVFKDLTETHLKNEEIVRIKERSEIAMHGASIGIWDLEPETNEAHWSSMIGEILGFSAGHELTRSEIFERVLDKDKALIQSYPDRLLNIDDEREVDVRMRHNDGHIVHVQLRGDAIRDEAGNIKCLAGSFTDITQEKLAETLREQLWEILIEQAYSTEEKFDRILRMGTQYFGLEMGIISRIENDKYEVTHLFAPDAELSSGDTFDFADTYCQHVFSENTVQAFHSVGTSRIKSHPCYEKFGLEAYIGAPIFVAGRRYGTINFSSSSPLSAPFSSTKRQIVEQISQWIGYEIDKAQSTQSLKESQERFSTAVQGASVGIWDWKDLSQRESYWSDHLYGLLGYYPGEIDASMDNFMLLIHPADREKFRHALELHLNQHVPLNIEYRMRHKSQKYMWFLGTGQALWNSDGQARRVIGSIMDIDTRKQAEVMKSEFVSNVSHELRTPMTSIMGSIGLIRSGKFGSLDPKAQSLLDIALKNGDRLVRLINDILDIEKIEAGKMDFSFKPESIEDVLSNTISTSQGFIEKSGATIRFVNKGNGVLVNADWDRLVQVFTNLISNAAKFSGDDGRIVVTLSNTDDDVIVSVSDNGIGIPQDKLDSIFEKFVQVEGGDNKTSQGTGLGLSISKAIIDAHQGVISVTSEPEAGTTFTTTLPRHFDLSASGDVCSANAYSPKLGTVLHVEDDFDVSAVVAHLVGDRANFMSCDTVKCAWQKLLSGDIDLVLLDLKLHGERGEQLIEKIESDLNYRPAVIIYSVEDDISKKFPDFVTHRFVKSKITHEGLLDKILSTLSDGAATKLMTGT